MSSKSMSQTFEGLNSRDVGKVNKWNEKESKVKMSQTERKRPGVKLSRRKLKELLAEEPLDLAMTLDEENSLRSDLHLTAKEDEVRQRDLEQAQQDYDAEREAHHREYVEYLDDLLLGREDHLDDICDMLW